jgi:hypothetical protein
MEVSFKIIFTIRSFYTHEGLSYHFQIDLLRRYRTFNTFLYFLYFHKYDTIFTLPKINKKETFSVPIILFLFHF